MESLQNIKRRIKGITNIGQITKAMELVAATKMRKSQEIALDSRPYAYAALEILASLSRLDDVPMPALMQSREVKKSLIEGKMPFSRISRNFFICADSVFL